MEAVVLTTGGYDKAPAVQQIGAQVDDPASLASRGEVVSMGHYEEGVGRW